MQSSKTLFRVFLLALFVSGGCATQVVPDPNWDYNVNTDFARLKTYAWHPVGGTVSIDNLMRVRLKNAVDDALRSKGLALSDQNPDFLIVMNGGRTVQYDTRWKNYYQELYYEEGRLKLSFMDPRSAGLIWWGETKTDLFFQMTPEQKDKIVAEVVTRILQKFPPHTSN